MKTNIKYSYFLSTENKLLATFFDTKEEAIQDRENASTWHGRTMGSLAKIDGDNISILY